MTFPTHINTYKHNNIVNDDTMRQLKELSPNKIIDFGAGDGFYGKLVKYLFPECITVGVEVEESYVEKFGLVGIYDELLICDLVDYINNLSDNNYDIAIFGDVIEHLEEEVVKEVIRKVNTIFPYILINSPIGFQAQDHELPSEIHRCGLDKTIFADYTIVEWNQYENDTMFNCLLEGGT